MLFFSSKKSKKSVNVEGVRSSNIHFNVNKFILKMGGAKNLVEIINFNDTKFIVKVNNTAKIDFKYLRENSLFKNMILRGNEFTFHIFTNIADLCTDLEKRVETKYTYTPLENNNKPE